MHLTQNEYTVTGSFYFAEEICKQDPNLYMTRFLIYQPSTARNH